jgi:prepilin-type N-terminal cleavage/methylation domain-containing protein
MRVPPKKRVLGGFTLIELLVVIAIVGILLAVVIGTITLSLKQARDARRLQDLRSIATTLELYHAETGRYPVAAGPVTGCGIGGANWIPDGSNYDWSLPYVAIMPRDPAEDCTSENPRSYAYQSDGRAYELTARLEADLPDSGIYFDGESFQSFTAPVSVSITSSLSSPTNQSPIPVTVTFSREVVNFTQSSVTILRGIVSNFVQTLTTAYTLFITPTDNDSVVVSLSSGAVQDSQGIGNASAQYVITYDSVSPHPALSPDPFPASVSGPFTVDVNFTKAVANFSAGDIVVQNGSASGLQSIAPGVNINFRFTVTPQSPGSVSVFIPAGVANSAAGNGNVSSNTLTTTYTP